MSFQDILMATSIRNEVRNEILHLKNTMADPKQVSHAVERDLRKCVRRIKDGMASLGPKCADRDYRTLWLESYNIQWHFRYWLRRNGPVREQNARSKT